ncbi:MAG: DUF4287 domain-containing protein [Phycisphaerales bacterium]|nr:DUF4287 domain-containing protein [Phycisphaerales bacterium]
MAKSPEEMEAVMASNLKEATGKSIDQWVAIAAKTGLQKHGQLVACLKTDHGLTHGYANLVAHRTFKSAASDADPSDLVAAQYAGPKHALRPVYEALAEAVSEFGPDVELSPKKAYVSVRRAKQFAIFQPSTATRLDVGINLNGVAPSERLEESGSFNSMVTHRVRVGGLNDVDAQLVGWLRRAYDAAD